MKTQVRCASVAGVAQEAKLVAGLDFVSDFDLGVARLEVSVEAVESIAVIYDHIVAIYVLKINRAGVG